MKNLLLVALAIFVVGSGYFYIKQTPLSSAPAPVAQVSPAPAVEANQVFNIKGLNYAYDVKEIKVKKGDVIKINFTNTEGFHDLKIDEFNVATKQIKVNESESITFTADKTGTFEYYCSVGQHRANGMWGKLIVE